MMTPLNWFKKAIAHCQSKHDAVLDLMARTDEALYEAIRCVYALYLRIRADRLVHEAFYYELRSNKMRSGDNEALALVELAFFPHVLLAGTKGTHRNHKAEIDKASSYAKAISYAHTKGLKPQNFVEFLRKNGGIQATAKAATDRVPQNSGQTGGDFQPPRRPGVAAAAAGTPPPGADCRLPVTLWCSTEIANEINQLTLDAWYHSTPLIERFIIRGQWTDTGNAIVTNFAIASKASPMRNPPVRPMRQPSGKYGPSSQASTPAPKAMRPPVPKRPLSQPPGVRPTPLRQKPFGKTALGKTPPGKTPSQQ